MNMHKRIRLTPYDRQEVWRLYQTRKWKVTHLANHFRVSRPTIYKVIKQARLQQFTPAKSTNKRYQSVQYGIKRLAKIEAKLQAKLKAQAKRYNKSLPLYEQALAIVENSLGERHPYYAISLNNLAGLLESMSKYQKALPLYEQALAILEKALGKEHPNYKIVLKNYAELQKR